MNRYRAALGPYLEDMAASFMFLICLGAPVAFVAFNHWAIPQFNLWLSARLASPDVLVPYYEAIDAFVICITTTMVGYTGVLVVLDEQDAGVTLALCCTPLGKGGYGLTRIGVPVVLAAILPLSVIGIGQLSQMPAVLLVTHTVLGVVVGAMIALLVMAYANNRIEGIALTKVGNVLLLAIPIGATLSGIAAMPFMWLPTYWIGRFSISHHPIDVLAALITGIGWIVWLRTRFSTRLQ